MRRGRLGADWLTPLTQHSTRHRDRTPLQTNEGVGLSAVPPPRIRPRWVVALAVAGVLGVSVVTALPSSASTASRAGTPIETITPLVATPLSSPHPVRGVDDRVHLVYELFVTNPTDSVMELTELETLGVGGGRTQHLSTLAGAELNAAIKPFVPGSALTLEPAQVTRLFLDATLARTARLPRLLKHRFTFTLTSSERPPSTNTVMSGRTDVVKDSPVVVGPPLVGARWVVGGGCCFPASYHRTATLPVNGTFHGPERFAIDFVQLRDDNTLFSGPLSDLSSYAFFGSKLLSVADGVVVGRQDGQPEQTPPDFPAGGTAHALLGNYLVIKIAPGHFAFYAHLQPHSLRVRLGQRVKRGSVIGRLGNTGNSDAPHLHFMMLDGPGPWSSEGLPYEFRSFGSEGTITSPSADLQEGKPVAIGPVNAGHHRRELPFENEVIGFPGRP